MGGENSELLLPEGFSANRILIAVSLINRKIQLSSVRERRVKCSWAEVNKLFWFSPSFPKCCDGLILGLT
jgi:hypothetical protein